MNQRSFFLIQESVRSLVPIAEQADTLFARRLLDTYPDTYRLFAIDLEPQARKFVPTLALVVNEIPSFGSMLLAVRALARSRQVCRLVEAHYGAVGATLIWTLRRCLGENFTRDVERAWHEALLTHWSARRDA